MKLLSDTPIVAIVAGVTFAQGLAPQKLLQLPTDDWPTYNGDYSGRRFSPLTQINDERHRFFELGVGVSAWLRVPGSAGSIKATPLMVNGVLYFTIPDHVWAVDARSGQEIWHYAWETKGGIHLGNRGVGIYENWLYFETPDCNLVSLSLKDGKERWHKQICDIDQFYYSSVAPIVIKNHVLVGVSGDDLDIPGYLESRDPETGDLQWHWSTRAEARRARFGDLA